MREVDYGSRGFGFENTNRFGIHEEHIVGEAALDVGLAKGDTRGGVEVEPATVLNEPAGGGEGGIYELASASFGC